MVRRNWLQQTRQDWSCKNQRMDKSILGGWILSSLCGSCHIHHAHYNDKCLSQATFMINIIRRIENDQLLYLCTMYVWSKSRRLYVVWSFQVQRVLRSKKSFWYSTYCTFTHVWKFDTMINFFGTNDFSGNHLACLHQ